MPTELTDCIIPLHELQQLSALPGNTDRLTTNNLLVSLVAAFSLPLAEKFFAPERADQYIELAVRLPLSESRFERIDDRIRVFRDSEMERRDLSITFRQNSRSGRRWVPYAGRISHFWDKFRDLDEQDVPQVANMILRTMIDEKIWENRDNAIWRLGRYEPITIGFRDEFKAVKSGGKADESPLVKSDGNEEDPDGDFEPDNASCGGESEYWPDNDDEIMSEHDKHCDQDIPSKDGLDHTLRLEGGEKRLLHGLDTNVDVEPSIILSLPFRPAPA